MFTHQVADFVQPIAKALVVPRQTLPLHNNVRFVALLVLVVQPCPYHFGRSLEIGRSVASGKVLHVNRNRWLIQLQTETVGYCVSPAARSLLSAKVPQIE